MYSPFGQWMSFNQAHAAAFSSNITDKPVLLFRDYPAICVRELYVFLPSPSDSSVSDSSVSVSSVSVSSVSSDPSPRRLSHVRPLNPSGHLQANVRPTARHVPPF